MILHIHQNLKAPRRSHSPAGGKLVKTAAEACMTDLKARYTEHFLSENVIQMQQIATDVSECIASIIFSSPDEDFREQCASIVDLPLRNLEEIENLIRMKMVKIIQRHDGFKKRKTGANDLGGYINELALDEDDNEPLYYDNENEEFL